MKLLAATTTTSLTSSHAKSTQRLSTEFLFHFTLRILSATSRCINIIISDGELSTQ